MDVRFFTVMKRPPFFFLDDVILHHPCHIFRVAVGSCAACCLPVCCLLLRSYGPCSVLFVPSLYTAPPHPLAPLFFFFSGPSFVPHWHLEEKGLQGRAGSEWDHSRNEGIVNGNQLQGSVMIHISNPNSVLVKGDDIHIVYHVPCCYFWSKCECVL